MSNLITNIIIIAYNKGYRITNGELYRNGKRLNTCLTTRGYRRFSIRVDNNKIRSVCVHRLVAYQKFGIAMFKKRIQVRHLDGNKLNNSDENIALGTPYENQMDKSPEIRLNSALIATSFCKKYNHESILNCYKSGMSYGAIMKKFNISSKGTISFIIRKSYSKYKIL